MSDSLPAILMRPMGWEEPLVSDGGFVLPTGTVTLLLSDVEGSTRAWEGDPAATQAALEKLSGLVDEIVGRYDGVRPLEQGEGDSFVAAFGRARDAVACALSLQLALAGGPLKVRLGLHTGDVIRRDEGNYAGPTIIRAARLRNIAHGGQTVVSDTTRALVADALPEGVWLRDLGAHRLKDLSRPEQVFQLCHPDLAANFPPLRSLDLHPHNLPVQRTTFIGRQTEMTEIGKLLQEERLVSINGSGGCGKTRLALQVAAESTDRYPDGVWLIDLTKVSDGQGVASKAVQALGAMPGPALSPLDAVVAHLRDRRALLVIDNCEHVIDAAGELVDAVLGGCPAVTLLATSRQPLGVDGETCWRLPSLSLPAPDRGPAGITGLGASEAEQLFTDRAAHVRPGFVADDLAREAIAVICRRLDGIPLAIELAAARIRVLSPAQIAAGLDERFRLLTGTSRTALPRQQTVEASLDWSHNLLTDPEKVLFRRLSAFSGSFDLDSVTDVCAGDGIEFWQVLDLLTLLIDKNLVTVEDRRGAARYRLLETVRLYGGRWLEAAGELETVRAHHFEHFARHAETAAPAILTADAPEWLERLGDDYPDIDAALLWARSNGDSESICRLVSALAMVWALGGPSLNVPVAAAIEWMDLALDSGTEMTPRDRGMLIWGRCTIGFAARWRLGGQDRMLQLAHEGLELARTHGDDLMLGRFLLGVGQAMMHTKQSRPFLEEGLAASTRADDQFMIAFHHAALSLLWYGREPSLGRHHASEAARIGLATRNLAARSGAVGVTGVIHLLQGRPLKAIDWLSRAYELGEEARFAFGVVVNEGFRSLAYAAAGMWDEAEASVRNQQDLGGRTGLGVESLSLQTQALLHAQQGHHEQAVNAATTAIKNTPPSSSLEFAYSNLVTVELAAGEIEAAARHLEAMRKLAAAEEYVFSQARADVLGARLRRMAGEHSAASALATSALGAALDLDAPGIAIDALDVLAGLAHDAGDDEAAARLLGAADTARATAGYQLCLSDRDADRTAIRQELGEQYERLTGEGAALSLSNAGSYATRGRGPRHRPLSGWESLTPVETEIVELVAAGRTNAGIGQQLFVSPRTVQAHLTRIFRKLDVRSRAELASKAANRASA